MMRDSRLLDKQTLTSEPLAASTDLPAAPLTQQRKMVGLCASAVFLTAITLYWFTLAPTVTLVDSGELIVAVRTLGVAHPPGFPLYVVLGHLATLVPIGNVAQRVNFASALFAALAASVFTLAAVEALMTPAGPPSARRPRDRRRGEARRRATSPDDSDPADSPRPSIEVLIAATIAGLLFAFSRTLWAYATIAEVYTLNSLLVVLVFYLMLRWRRKSLAAGRRTRPQQRGKEDILSREDPDWLLYTAAFVFGLAIGVHHVTVAVTLPAAAALVYSTEGPRFFASRRLLHAALFSFAGLLIYVYLPIAASRSPLMNWGDPSTIERLIWHVTGKQYATFFTFSPKVMAGQLGSFLQLTAREFGSPWLPAGLVLCACGVVDAFRRNRAIFWFIVLVIAVDLSYGLGYEIAEDKDAYYLPAFIAMSIGAGLGARWLIRATGRTTLPALAARWSGAVALTLAPAVALAGNLAYNNRARYFIARDYVQNVFSTIEPGGMLLTQDWQVYSPLLYLREVEKVRTDVVALDVNQLRRSPWYFDYLRQVYPELIEANGEEIDAFLEDLNHWQRDPEAFARDPALVQRISAHFFGMLSALVENHLKTAPVYVTIDVAADQVGENAEFTKYLTSNYRLVPEGLVFEASRDRGFHEPAEPRLEVRGLADGTLKFEDEDTVKLKVLPAYVGMLVSRGRYLAAHGKKDRAIECYRQALVLDPNSSVARQSLAAAAKP